MGATTPSVGRILHYIPGRMEHLNWFDVSQPLACQIVQVLTDGNVSIVGHDQSGEKFFRGSVRIVPEGEQPPEHGYCQWMPYQRQVAKGEAEPVRHA